MSDIHRKDDFLWSGVGLIYALVLWYCARNITGAVLLGQAAATALLVSYSWQTLKLRRAIANPDKAAEINNFSVLQKINGLLKRKQPTVQPAPSSVETTVPPKVTEEIAIPDTPARDTAQIPAPGTVPPKEASNAPVTAAIENRTVESDSKPELSEARSSSKEKDNQTPDVKSTSKTEADTSTQETEIVKSQPAKPKVVVQDKRKDNTITAENTEATPVPKEPKADREPKVVQDKRKDNTVTAKNIEATPASPSQPKAKAQKSADTGTGDRPKIESSVTQVQPEPQTTSEEKSSKTDVQPEPQTTPEAVPVKVEPVATSPLDSLETVEVAEVLEAAEDTTINLDTDRSNIIEVTTTEINITTEVTKLEQKPEDDSNFQENKSQ